MAERPVGEEVPPGRRTSQPTQAFAHVAPLLVVCEPLSDGEAEMRTAAEAVKAALLGKQPLPWVQGEREWVISWSAWEHG